MIKENILTSGIRFYDGAIREDHVKLMQEDLRKLPFFFGEKDSVQGLETGLVCNVPFEHDLGKFLVEVIAKIDPELAKNKLERIYVNLFKPYEYSDFHIDGENVMTCLFYGNDLYHIDEGGETQFIIDGVVLGVLPVPGRVCIFPGWLQHRATPFKHHHRFTIAVKFTVDQSYIDAIKYK